MNTLVAWTANYLLWVIAAIAICFWFWRETSSGKLRLTASGVLGLGFGLLLVMFLAHLHQDPRPFVQNPHLHPLIAHSADNGFPSDHCVVAGLAATLVALRDRIWGGVLAVAAIIVAAARVAAHVHHVQDVVAGLAIGFVAAIAATLVVDTVFHRSGLAGHESAVVRPDE